MCVFRFIKLKRSFIGAGEEIYNKMEATYKPRGFINKRNACFLNSAMQILLSITPLHEAIEQGEGPFSSAFRESKSAKHLLETGSSFWTITELFLGYTPRVIQQNCAAEFLRFFLGNLDFELAQNFPKQRSEQEDWLEAGKRNIQQTVNFVAQGNSILYEFIGLCTKTDLRVKGHSSITFQDELILSVKAEDTLFAAMANAFRPTIPEDFKEAGVGTKSKMSMQVSSYSKYLIVHIQRFYFQEGRVLKIDKFVEFPPRLSIPEKLLTHSLRHKISNNEIPPPGYSLVGLIEHHGRSADSGHYTCVVRHQNNWVFIDDQLVRFITPQAVSQKKAYILLYKLRE